MSIQDPILLDLPMPITTNRLTIRPLMPGDGKQLYALLEHSREEYGKWFNWIEGVSSWTDVEHTAREFYSEYILRKTFCFPFFLEDELLGVVGYNNPNWAIPSAELGYYIHLDHQGKGYIREAVTAIIQYAFKEIGFKKLSILCDEENTRSITVAESLGFELEAKSPGVTSVPNATELRMGRCYVRFDTEGLEDFGVKW
ncbi:MAG: hypothetical protein COZ46_03130 [Verrucomicrobia bacterium CG_4_10_14_3_um_filter_43_23]|nr:MAG: hypothetical protein AUJ82_00555 [Verrucomicrobia bacterium CG1_02_43_26]PIP59237.1 MAG: hypothetical protein COX01_04380 [Verrucomicrobia bacterium CG22_combo_CG10-13_8_21_14_all_43_17]PIX58579.1 MAG: hypothetical protein COZ46_03130 [Verrucomicrobia bacterium CG_4_10_14_3_um_filter_43_23]PIY61031.1 MAG: hypothetical protein COY94_07450 [Verrucomicrobia bacterium CG_4_10_14_0_8_um_filter_43_34]PJA43872.1 MAG: hypothetical protein CO175_05820 [Verrucomicrobia bacterium CG_4_9_14_3_um_fi